MKKTLPSKLAYRKGIEFTEGTILNNLRVELIRNLGLKTFDGVKENNKKKETNGVINPIMPTEKVYLMSEDNFLNVQYGIKITGINSVPEISENLLVHKEWTDAVNKLKEDSKILKHISDAITYNILSGIVGFRNRDNAQDVKTKVVIGNETLNFNSINYRNIPKNPFGKTLEHSNIDEIRDDNFEKLSLYIKEGLEGNLKIIDITTSFEIGAGFPIYPSELFESSKTEKRYYRTLASDKTKYGFTPEKLWNGIRTFDSFFDISGPAAIAAEPTGASLKVGDTLRSKSKNFYSLMLSYLEKNEISDEDKFFILTIILRGGLFQKTK